jgi:hypothetical protein
MRVKLTYHEIEVPVPEEFPTYREYLLGCIKVRLPFPLPLPPPPPWQSRDKRVEK